MFVDFVTVVWLIVFVFGFVFSEYSEVAGNINLFLLPVFVADLYVGYRRSGSFKYFVRRKWLDILMVIPYFRIFRILRVMRAIRAVRAARAVRASRSVRGALKAAGKGMSSSSKALAGYFSTIFSHFQKWYKAYKKLLRIARRLLRK